MLLFLTEPLCFQDAPYLTTLPQLGHAVIVNNVAKEMPGSLEDVRALDAAFRKVGFKVEVHNNMTKTVSETKCIQYNTIQCFFLSVYLR